MAFVHSKTPKRYHQSARISPQRRNTKNDDLTPVGDSVAAKQLRAKRPSARDLLGLSMNSMTDSHAHHSGGRPSFATL